MTLLNVHLLRFIPHLIDNPPPANTKQDWNQNSRGDNKIETRIKNESLSVI